MLRRVHCSANAEQQAVAAADRTPQQTASLEALQQVFTPLEVEKLASSKPSVLDLPTSDWLEFFEGYRLPKAVQWRTLRYSTHELADPFTAGAAIRWLKQLGPWTDADVAERLLPCYPKVLATSDASLTALYDHIRGLGFSHEDVQSLLWEFPGLMADFRQELLPLITRMVESRRNKYTNGGLYVD